LRSANRGNANNTWNVNSSGNVNNNNANNANRFAPIVIYTAAKSLCIARETAVQDHKEPVLPAVSLDMANNADAMPGTPIRLTGYQRARKNVMNEEKENIISYDALYESAMKCKRGVLWKPATKHFNLNAVMEIHRMEDKLRSGTWKNGRPKPIQILYPKKRDGLSISFKDRVYQRSINDNVLYPAVSRSFILDNCACQKGKGIDFARKRLKKHLWNHYSHYGTEGYILQVDIRGYYPNMRHDAVIRKFSRYLSPEVLQMVKDVLDTQYVGEVGYNPGSQMVQIAGISLLDDLDHYCKEQLHCRHYLRYMDDILIITPKKADAERCLDRIREKLSEIGFEVHPDKTHIRPLSRGFRFLGFDYRITETGKIIMTLNSENIRHERRKLRRLVKLAKEGRITKAKADECFRSWCENAGKGNSWKLLRRMRAFYNDLWRNEDESRKAAHDRTGAG